MDSHPPFTAQERTECRAFGTIPNSDLQSLQDLLLGCSGSQGLPFKHHEVVLKNDAKPPVVVYLVQALHEGESKQSPQSSSNSSRVIRECKRSANTHSLTPFCIAFDVSLLFRSQDVATLVMPKLCNSSYVHLVLSQVYEDSEKEIVGWILGSHNARGMKDIGI